MNTAEASYRAFIALVLRGDFACGQRTMLRTLKLGSFATGQQR